MTTPATYVDADFRAQFPVFQNSIMYPEATLSALFTNATNFISPLSSFLLTATATQNALYLMTAHLATLAQNILTNGGTPAGAITSAKIKDVAITIQAPPATNAYKIWLNQTPWGQQLLALFSVKAVGGMYIGGQGPLLAFRRGPLRFR